MSVIRSGLDERPSDVERSQLDEPAGAGSTIDDLFNSCVKRHADRRAVTCQGRSLTYAQLDRRVDALARRLVKDGVETGDRVALWLEPSIEVAIAMLGILRAGATYLPIDSHLPIDRVQYLLDDSGAKVLLVMERRGGPPGFHGRVLDLGGEIDPDLELELDLRRGLELEPELPLELRWGRAGVTRRALPEISDRDCAYLIYTSGTTGRPKGVLIEHRSLVNYVTWFRRQYGVDGSHTAALLTSHAFDLGYTTLWTTLLSGGELHFIPESMHNDLPAVARYVAEHRVSFLKVTPSLLGALVGSSAFDRERCSSLRLIVTGGEPVRPRDVERLYVRCPGALVVNHYGPTETTIGVTTHPIERAELADFARRPVIGRPIGNTWAYVVTPDLQLAGSGEVGELLIGGRGVGRGYHGRDELTRERFIPDPFGGSGTVYRTGDLARWTEEGTLELLGRADRQLKLRGYRVEPAEIEQVILDRFAVREAVVVARQLGESNQVLCAYYTGETSIPAAELRARLAEVLPEYMVPAYALHVAELPRSANGKLDVERLPRPGGEAAAGGTAAEQRASDAAAAPGPAPGEPPRSETERTLLKMWSALFGLDAAVIGVSRNFFELGGHSLLMIQLIAEIDDAFGKEVPVPAFFAEGTIRALAQILDGAPS